ncbi:MAG: hypothetical protein SF053_19915 [Bacteroidia bacterium]|nr:hypothetical protein [Bacteroidia bacterium]
MMKTIWIWIGLIIIACPVISQPYARQWVELRHTSYCFPEWTANRRATGTDLGFDPFRTDGIGLAVSRLWYHDRLLTRFGYDFFFSREGFPSSDYRDYFAYRKYHQFLAEAGPVLMLGAQKRHFFTATLGLLHVQGWEQYIKYRYEEPVGSGYYSSVFADRYPADWGLATRLEYHVSPVRFVRVGVFGQYQRFIFRGNQVQYFWLEEVEIAGRLSWGVILGLGY